MMIMPSIRDIRNGSAILIVWVNSCTIILVILAVTTAYYLPISTQQYIEMFCCRAHPTEWRVLVGRNITLNDRRKGRANVFVKQGSCHFHIIIGSSTLTQSQQK